MKELLEMLKTQVERNEKSEFPEDDDATGWGNEEGILISHGQAKLILESLASKDTTESSWISVEDRLPKEVEVVLCVTDNSKLFMGYTKYELKASSIIWFVDVNSNEVGNNKLEETTHWQPLPPPPKEEEKKKEEGNQYGIDSDATM